MTDWADEIAEIVIDRGTDDWEFYLETRVAAALRRVRDEALTEAGLRATLVAIKFRKRGDAETKYYWQAHSKGGEVACMEASQKIRALKDKQP